MLSYTGLYYPFIHFKDESWLKNCILYWDKMGRIVPDGYGSPHDSEAVKRLKGEIDFIKDFHPTFSDTNRLCKDFLYLLSKNEEDLVSKYGVATIDLSKETLLKEQDDTYTPHPEAKLEYVYQQKISKRLHDKLIDSGLALPNQGRDEEWIGMHTRLVSVYMTALASVMAKSRQIRPVTDETVDHMAMYGFSLDQITQALLGDVLLKPIEARLYFPHELLDELYYALKRSDYFTNDESVRSIFVDSRISKWKYDLPQAQTTSITRRVYSIVDFLQGQQSAEGENALILFLKVLADKVNEEDSLHYNLQYLISDLEREKRQQIEQFSSMSTPEKSSPRPQTDIGTQLAILRIQTLVPKNIEAIPIEKFIKLRKQHYGELGEFQRYINEITQENSFWENIEDEEWLKEQLENEISKTLTPQLKRLKRVLDDVDIDATLGAMNIGRPLPSDSQPLAKMTASQPIYDEKGTFVLNSISIPAPDKRMYERARERELDRSPISYLIRLEEGLKPVELNNWIKSDVGRFELSA